ncbi:hypothetical protein EQV77_14285 [Halobacillus fulvus]|nr:hypothetical protein EQV77_14285 [Halobacillus fulvus]
MKRIWILLLVTILIILAGCSQSEEEGSADSQDPATNESSSGDTDTSEDQTSSLEEVSSFEGSVDHVHGVGYLDGETVTFAAHEGLKLYQNGEWLQADLHKNDYMGFNMVDEGFYVSGHPGPNSDLPNPLGLQKGTVDEQLSSIGFVGESDFHAMGVGYNSHAVYVLNEQPNSELDQGLYRSFDGGETWERLKAENLDEKLFQIAVHPTDEKKVAVASQSGIYLSEDAGDTFERVSAEGQGSGIFFAEDELFYGLYTGEAAMKSYQLEDGSIEEVPLPDMTEDAVMYTAQNPQNPEELTIFTISGHAYQTENAGEEWTQIINNGTTQAS